VANTLAYYDTTTITAIKTFIVQALVLSYNMLFPPYFRNDFCSFLVDAFFMKAQSNMIASNKDKVLPPGALVKDALSPLNDCQGDLQFLGLKAKHLFPLKMSRVPGGSTLSLFSAIILLS
jgi:hypothetical protein